LIQGLMAAQQQNEGWLSREIITAVADYLELPASWAYEIATFYSMFDLQPVGRHKVNICTNISCWLNGAEDLLAHAEKKLGLKLGETTEDGRISLVREEECLAGCCGAPMMVVDGHYHENLDIEKMDTILDGLE
jgi:NADH-quinone oxidoreductase subunit E